MTAVIPTLLLFSLAWLKVSGFCSSATTRIHRLFTQEPSPSSRYSSVNNANNNNNNDEISKLIGKRNQIKRKRLEEQQQQQEQASLPMDESVIDLDLNSLPQLRTERPVRSSSRDKDASEKEEGKKASSSAPDYIIDYLADYDDENDFHIPNRMGVSTRDWGDPSRRFVPPPSTPPSGKSKKTADTVSPKLSKRLQAAGYFVPGDVQLAVQTLLSHGITLFETSPTYGQASLAQKLSAPQLLQQCLQQLEQEQASSAYSYPEAMIMTGTGRSGGLQTLLQTVPWAGPLTTRSLMSSLEQSCEQLGTAVVELCQASCSAFSTRQVSGALSAVIESGQANRVGVQGLHSPRALQRLRRRLEAREMTLSTATFEFSLTYQKHAKMLAACRACQVVPLIVNPLHDGLASGVYTATNPSGGQAGGTSKFSFKTLEQLQPLHSVQETLADRVSARLKRDMQTQQDRVKPRYGPPPTINTEISTTQIALQYIIAKGGVPLVPVNTPAQAEQVVGCLGWTLTEEEVNMLDAAVALCKLK